MGSHPLNLALRFLLEVSALVAMGVWGWQYGEGWLRFVLAVGVPLVAAAIWGTFAVPDDPSRSGTAPIAVAGTFRLAIELAVFAFAVWAAYEVGFTKLSFALAVIVAIHYAASYDRVQWLIRR